MTLAPYLLNATDTTTALTVGVLRVWREIPSRSADASSVQPTTNALIAVHAEMDGVLTRAQKTRRVPKTHSVTHETISPIVCALKKHRWAILCLTVSDANRFRINQSVQQIPIVQIVWHVSTVVAKIPALNYRPVILLLNVLF